MSIEPLLLADPSPSLRLRVLTELLEVPESDPEVAELAAQLPRVPEVRALLDEGGDDLRELAWRSCRLAYLGLDASHEGVAAIAERILERQLPDGSFPLAAFRPTGRDGTYDMVPLQVALPLRGLAAVGLATDPRAERAYAWLLEQRLEDGAWPMGIAAGQPGYIAGYRRLPGSPGCRVNTEAAIACLVLHPRWREDPATRRALDLLLQRETREEWALGSEVARLVGAEPATGFVTFYARYDLAFVLDMASRAGAGLADPRIADLVAFLEGLRGPGGLWHHPTRPELGRWLTFDLLASLRRLAGGAWAGGAPRVPFRARRRGTR